ncbi:MAG: hypothetical protein V1875_10475 [Candidatus Altiarchaeota archaeon]
MHRNACKPGPDSVLNDNLENVVGIGKLRRPINVVILGNVGYTKDGTCLAERTEMLALRNLSKTMKYDWYPKTEFIGIDLNECTPRTTNWRQIRANFKEGLDRLEDGTVDLIISDMSIGFYNRLGIMLSDCKPLRDYTTETLRGAYAKLKNKRKILLSVVEERIDLVRGCLFLAGFNEGDIKVSKFGESHYDRTPYTRELKQMRQGYWIAAEK